LTRLAILNDLHFGVRNGNSIFENELKSFLENDFSPKIEEENITDIIVAGDVFDDRKSINIKTLNLIHGSFLEPFSNKNIHIIPGNHDVYYKNVIHPNCISPVIHKYENIKFYDKPTIVNFDNYPIQFIPWICAENEEECLEAIESNLAKTIITHTDIMGSQNVPGIFLEHGFSLDTFFKYDFVLNGHIHTKSQIGANIHNLGTQYQFNWSDYGQKKGFHIFDTSNASLTFIPNKRDDLYVKIFYENNLISGVESLKWLSTQLERLTNKFIKVIVTGDIDRFIFDKFINILNNDIKTYDIKIIEDIQNMFSDTISDEIVESKSTIHIIHDMIDDMNMEKNINKDIIKSLMSKFYTEAINKGSFSE
jgi:DNA repair exonuclease SbcCD nuclease subunit